MVLSYLHLTMEILLIRMTILQFWKSKLSVIAALVTNARGSNQNKNKVLMGAVYLPEYRSKPCKNTLEVTLLTIPRLWKSSMESTQP